MIQRSLRLRETAGAVRVLLDDRCAARRAFSERKPDDLRPRDSKASDRFGMFYGYVQISI